ncbi:hypothetical protein NIES2119_00645 [[Phormidium ambiguum] IAM M-71]|uniref:Uncharacterized protein n=1 Tax=[Phormidium ambiguum] IAM M-71 TaxID=454136 RepID=A0A1U7ITP7_9CYAN|nr:hypothetical protein [Phormidium ambiguum]OKH40855.1 hypothetical protein NIES2119_00645 [Phormidium ambiguum IAM M-71]
MSQHCVANTNGYSAVLFFILLILSASFGYVVGKDHKEDYLNQQQTQQIDRGIQNGELES